MNCLKNFFWKKFIFPGTFLLVFEEKVRRMVPGDRLHLLGVRERGKIVKKKNLDTFSSIQWEESVEKG